MTKASEGGSGVRAALGFLRRRWRWVVPIAAIAVAIASAVAVGPRILANSQLRSEGPKALCEAIGRRDSRSIKRYLDAGLPLDPVTGGKTTGRVECWSGGDYNLPFDESPLGGCASGGRSAYAKLLIHLGANVNGRCTDQVTPLHFAAYHSDLAFLRVLLDHGADPNAKDVSGHVPLEVVHPYNVDGMLLLFEKGARYNLSSIRARNEDADEAIPPPAMSDRRTTLNLMLIVACGYPNERSIRRLLAGRRDPNVVKGGSNPAAVARMLLDKGADVNVRARVRCFGRWAGRLPAVFEQVMDDRPIDGYTALELARYHNDSVLEKLLLKHGAKGKPTKGAAK